MKRVLITGGAGFAGGHLLDLLAGDVESVLIGWKRPGEPLPPTAAAERTTWTDLDIRDRYQVDAAIEQARPDVIYHLAGAAHVGAAWTKTAETFAINALGTHRLIEAVRHARLSPRILIPSSAYVYRPSADAIDEQAPVQPDTPYGMSKLAQEMAGLRAFEDSGLPVMIARAFNHVGPRQDPSFATSSFARQIALIEAGKAEAVLHVGNLSARRDLTDVRDTVRAYRLIAEHGAPGRIYNVCTGVARPVQDALDALLRASRVPIEVRVDPARLRPSDTPVVLGDYSRLQRELDWHPQLAFDDTLKTLLDFWRASVQTT